MVGHDGRGCFLFEGCLPCPSPAWDGLFIAARAVPIQLPARTFLGLFKILWSQLPPGLWLDAEAFQGSLVPQALLSEFYKNRRLLAALYLRQAVLREAKRSSEQPVQGRLRPPGATEGVSNKHDAPASTGFHTNSPGIPVRVAGTRMCQSSSRPSLDPSSGSLTQCSHRLGPKGRAIQSWP